MLLFLSVFAFSFQIIYSDLNVNVNNYEKKVLINGLTGIINFLNYDSENVNVDCLLGIVIADAQLSMILKNLNERNEFYETITKLKNRTFYLIQKIKRIIKIDDDDYYILFNKMLQPELWQINKPFINNTLSKFQPYNWNNLPSQQIIDNILFNGLPKEQESNYCLIDLANQGNIKEKHECNPNITCTNMMFNIKDASGYPLTHKLLYWQMAKAWNCIINTKLLNNIIGNICSKILREYRSFDQIEDNINIRDLYIEQMLLCGLEGFMEFLNENSRNNLIKWLLHKDSFKCYTQNIHVKIGRWRVRRTTNEMNFGCQSHITGLGIAALSLNLRYLFI